MPGDSSPADSRSDRTGRLTRIIDAVIDRRRSGEDLSDEAVIAEHTDLMPELGRRLSDVRRIEEAERLARQQDTSDSPVSDVGRATADPPPPDSFPGYRIEGEIQRGGQGVVYRATQEGTNRLVAIKVMREGPFSGTHGRARFEREVQILAALKHPNIVTIHGSGTAAGCAYFVMDYIIGQPLDEYVRARLTGIGSHAAVDRVSIAELLALFAKICQAVNVAHLRGVIHRDVKPGNIRVDPSGEPHILDFGLAKVAEHDVLAGSSPDVMTTTGQFVGSLPWTSPEQADGSGDQIDIRTDVYSLGVVLYQMLTGTFPYEVVGSLREQLDAILNAEPKRPSTICPRIDDEIETIVLKCLSKERERRYQTAGELARDIDRYLAGEAIEAKRDSAGYVLRKALRRHRVPAAIASAFVVLVAGASVALSIMYVNQRSARQGEAEQRRLAEQREQEAVAARTEAQQRASELETLTEFQRAMLSEVDAAKMGRGIVADQRARIRENLGSEGASAERIDAVLASFDELMTRVNATDVALKVVDEHVLSRAATTIERQFSDQPLTEAALRQAVGDTYYELGLYSQARTHLARAIELRRDALGDEHPHTLQSLHSLAAALTYLGAFDEGEANFRQALEARRRVLGAEHPDTLDSLRMVGALRALQGRIPEAESYLRAALEGRRRVLGDDHQDTLRSTAALGYVLLAMGRHEDAEPYIRAALEGRRRTLGDDHPDTISSLGSLGGLLQAAGRYDEAEPLYREALEGYRRAMGNEHPDTLAALGSLGGLLQEMGRYAEAERYLREDLETARRVLGARNPATVSSMYNLADLLAEMGGNVEAEALLREALEGFSRSLGADNPHTLGVVNRLGWLLTDMEKYQEAEPVCRDAMERRRRVLGDGDSATLDSIYNMGRLYSEWGRFVEAEPYHREAWTGRLKLIGSDDLDTLWSLYYLAQSLSEQRKFEQAEPLAQDCYRRNLAKFGPTHVETVETIELLVRLYDLWHEQEPSAGYDTMATEWRAMLPDAGDAGEQPDGE